MKALVILLPLAIVTGMFGQAVNGGFGSVVFPGGNRPSSGVAGGFGSVVFPGGAQTPTVRGRTPAIGAYTGGQNSNFRRNPYPYRGSRQPAVFVYAYPAFVGGYDTSYVPREEAPQQQQQQPNVTVIYLPQQPATPVTTQAGTDGEYSTVPRRSATIYEAPREDEPAAESAHYLLAFKDHTIYSAVAYWADGDTLHYFTTGNTHNQASISLLDRELTERLNREMGTDFKLPPAK